MKIILLDSEGRSSLSALRSLKARGLSVACASSKKRAISFYSRYCKEKIIYPAPGKDREGFSQFLKKYRDTQKEPLLFMCFSDVTMDHLMFAKKKRIFNEEIITPLPENYETSIDKKRLGELALTVNIPYPKSFEVNSEHAEEISHDLPYPIILKPRHSVSWFDGKAYKSTAQVLNHREEFVRAFLELKSKTKENPLVQEKLDGDEFGVSLLSKDGVIFALFAHKRLRSVRKFGGASSLRESMQLSEEMKDLAKRLAEKLSWSGVMMIELKQDKKTGRLFLIEINARFWGSLFLAIKSGVDFPYLLYKMRNNLPIDSEETKYESGVQARHFVSDLSHFYSLGFEFWKPQNIFKLFSFKKDAYHDVWSFNDPLPGIVEIFQFIWKKI